jgi:hypothetical protein
MSEDKRTAYHEAGHVVCAYLCKKRFHYVSIIPDTCKTIEDTLGHVHFVERRTNGARELDYWVSTHSAGYRPYPFPHKPEIQPRADVRKEAEIKMIINLAGYAAEWVFIDSDDEDIEFEYVDYLLLQDEDGENGDGQNAVAIATALTMDEQERDAYIELMRTRTRNILRQPAYRSATAALADELMCKGKIGYKRAVEIIHDAIQRASDDIQRNPEVYFTEYFKRAGVDVLIQPANSSNEALTAAAKAKKKGKK